MILLTANFKKKKLMDTLTIGYDQQLNFASIVQDNDFNSPGKLIK